MLVPEDLAAAKIIECVKSEKSKEIENVQIFDVYRGKGVPEGYKSIAVRIRYRSFERTLAEEEIAALHKKIVANLTDKLKVTLR
jgi:phenylalanyl-tRNA synthetase beta chain